MTAYEYEYEVCEFDVLDVTKMSTIFLATIQIICELNP